MLLTLLLVTLGCAAVDLLGWLKPFEVDWPPAGSCLEGGMVLLLLVALDWVSSDWAFCSTSSKNSLSR